ncbi:hypothetical protein RCL1_000268 [Eukaryota sp. TZLM3-RCL]
MSTFTHKLLDYLLLAQQDSILTDFEVAYNEVKFPCHKAIVTLYSSHVVQCLANNLSSYEVDENDEITTDDFISAMKSMYGKTLSLRGNNVLPFLFLSKSMGCSEFEQLCREVIRSSGSCNHGSVNTLLKKLEKDNYKDHQIIFHDAVFNFHKFLLATFSPYFRAKFSHQWEDTSSHTSDFTGLLQVSIATFSSFFKSFYNGVLSLSLENAFEYNHLAWYFQLSQLEQFTESFYCQVHSRLQVG